LLVFLLALVVLLAAAKLRPEVIYTDDLTAPDPTLRFIDGVHAVELFYGEPYRWTTDQPFVQLRHAFHVAPSFLARVTIRSIRPDGVQPITFSVNARPLAVVQPSGDLRMYRLLVPHWPDAEGSLRFAATTKALEPVNDLRRLGFMSTLWELEPQFVYRGLGTLTPDEVVWIVLGGLLLMAWLRWYAGWRVALSVGALVVAALLGLRQFYRPAPIPFKHLVLIALPAVGVLPWLTGRRLLPTLGLSILVVVVVLSGALWPSWMTDDALISFRYAQNLHAGHGLVYNIGERVEGYTNFLWTILAALVIALGGDPVYVSYYAGIIIALLIMVATFVLARRHIGDGWACVAVALLSTSQSLLLYTARGSGLETGLFSLFLVIASYLALSDRLWFSGIVFALATLTRPEGVLVLAIAGAVRLVARRRIEGGLVRMFGAFGLVGVPFFVWRLWYYGDPLPNTFYAKTGGGIAQAWRGAVYAGEFALFAGGPLLLVLLGLALVSALRTRRGERMWVSYAFVLVGVYTAYIISVGGDHFPGYRFFMPIMPFLAMLLAAGLRQLSDLGKGRVWQFGSAVAIVLALGLSSFNLSRSAAFDSIVQGDDASVWLWRELGWWFADHGRPGASMAALGAGAIPYYSLRPTIDLLGLTDKHIARLEVDQMGAGAAGHEKSDPNYVLHVRKPTYIPAIWDEYFGGAEALKATNLYQEREIVTRYGRHMWMWERLP